MSNWFQNFLEHRRSWNGLPENVATQPVSWPVTLDRLAMDKDMSDMTNNRKISASISIG
jgi:hypothetical protein